METEQKNNGTMKMRVEKLEQAVHGLSGDVVNMKVAMGRVETEIKNIQVDIGETCGSVKNICSEIRNFKDKNAEIIANNSLALGKITGRQGIIWALLFLILSGIVTLGFKQYKYSKDNERAMEKLSEVK